MEIQDLTKSYTHYHFFLLPLQYTDYGNVIYCSLLKIWNMNIYTGVLGVFNCQGAAWSNLHKKNVFHDTTPNAISGCIHADDVHLLAEAAEIDWNGDCAVYSHSGKNTLCVQAMQDFLLNK